MCCHLVVKAASGARFVAKAGLTGAIKDLPLTFDGGRR
jgi:hypothetical protein